jgi:hypothetical protein
MDRFRIFISKLLVWRTKRTRTNNMVDESVPLRYDAVVISYSATSFLAPKTFPLMLLGPGAVRLFLFALDACSFSWASMNDDVSFLLDETASSEVHPSHVTELTMATHNIDFTSKCEAKLRKCMFNRAPSEICVYERANFGRRELNYRAQICRCKSSKNLLRSLFANSNWKRRQLGIGDLFGMDQPVTKTRFRSQLSVIPVPGKSTHSHR